MVMGDSRLYWTFLALLLGSVQAAGKPPTPDTWVTVPERKPLPPEERGKPYKVPATQWKPDAVLWGYQGEVTGGVGFAFGGIHQLSEDGIGHTQLKVGGAWKEIHEELKQKNPLQKQHEATLALRNACKDLIAQGRHQYFEGRAPADESAWVKSTFDPAIEKLAAGLTALGKGWAGGKGSDPYDAGQLAGAFRHLEAALGKITPLNGAITPDALATLRGAQIDLELAAEALSAEPPPRSLSIPAYDAALKVFVVFGGEHFDYQTNDLWVFDLAKRRWFQKHPPAAPEARADHQLESLGEGRFAMFGGYSFQPKGRYSHTGPARWIYDLKKNEWSADGHSEKATAADPRSPQANPPSGPESFMKGARPVAAANEAFLKSIPVNELTVLKTPSPLGGRDWSTWVFDPQRDLFYVYGGGHASYPGNDVARYHLSTDRWEMTDPVEVPIGCAGTNEMYPGGLNYNGRPWCRNHVWNGQAYDPELKRMVLGSATNPKIDPYFYFYNPDKGDWNGRKRFPAELNNNGYAIQLRHTKHGLFAWTGDQAWLMDAKTCDWRKLSLKGKLIGTGVDSCGMAYDSKRDRMVLTSLGGYGKAYDGSVCVIDFAAQTVSALKAEAPAARWDPFLREPVYLPGNDLILFASTIKLDKKHVPDRIPAFDCATNRWVGVKIKMPPEYKQGIGNVCTSIAYDAKRGLVWIGNAAWNGNVCVLKLDLSKTEVTPLKNLVAEATIPERN